MTEAIPRYRITADVCAYRLDDKTTARVERLIRTFLEAIFPLGVVEGYPDIQEIATDTPFRTQP